MAIRHLINESGEPFNDGELDALAKTLDALDANDRIAYRNANASAIAQHAAERLLIVAGPGTGKSSIFKQRVLSWLQKNPEAKILALSFVRKLVADLRADIQADKGLSDEQKAQVDVFTLHKYARSIVERNKGTRGWSFAPHFRIIGQTWKEVAWHDVLLLSGESRIDHYSWKAFEKQLYDDQFDESAEWQKLRQAYFTLCQFYNAAGFSDLILRARDALAENPALNEHQFFIVDEYQDFNAAEEHLLDQIAGSAEGRLTVGDDDQVLYEQLKSGKAALIRAIYTDKAVVKAMLAFCGRCDFHITRAASHFIKQGPDPASIKKIYLPIGTPDNSLKVNVVGCASAGTAVDYIRKFIEDHSVEIERRKSDLAAGNSKDPYLLILSPSGAVNFYRPNGAQGELMELLKPFAEQDAEFSEDYYKVLNYYSLANFPRNNFTFRKVLYYEGISDKELLSLLEKCIAGKHPLCSIDVSSIKDAANKAALVRDIVDSKASVDEKVTAIGELIKISEPDRLRADMGRKSIDKRQVEAVEHQEEEDAELEEIREKPMSAVELMTIVGSKGLSADHVVIIGFDNVNMGWITRNAFFVAMTRARTSLHTITALKAGGATRAHSFLDKLPDAHLEFAKYTKGKRVREVFFGRGQFVQYLRNLRSQGVRR
jgi:superfamily I DNA/RNA helicase